MRILVTGVSGQVGLRVAAGLQAAGVDVRGGSGHPDRAGERPYPVVEVDLGRPETLRAALDGVDRVFLYAQAEGIEAQLAELRRAGVERIVAMTSASVEMTGEFALSTQLRAVEAAFDEAGLPISSLRPGVFASNTLGWAPAIRHQGAVTLPYPGVEVNPIHEADIADAAVHWLTGDETPPRSALMGGPQSITMRDQVAVLAEGLGRAIECREVGPDEWRTLMAATMPEPMIQAMLEIWSATDGVPQDVTHTVREITGQHARTYGQWVADHRGDFA